jgi:hypothetical protein
LKAEIPIGIGEVGSLKQIPHVYFRVIPRKNCGTGENCQMILDKSLEMVAIEFMEKGSVPCWKAGEYFV